MNTHGGAQCHTTRRWLQEPAVKQEPRGEWGRRDISSSCQPLQFLFCVLLEETLETMVSPSDRNSGHRSLVQQLFRQAMSAKEIRSWFKTRTNVTAGQFIPASWDPTHHVMSCSNVTFLETICSRRLKWIYLRVLCRSSSSKLHWKSPSS